MKEDGQRVKRRQLKRKLQSGDGSVQVTGPACHLMIFEHFTGTVWRKLLAALDHTVETTKSKKYSE